MNRTESTSDSIYRCFLQTFNPMEQLSRQFTSFGIFFKKGSQVKWSWNYCHNILSGFQPDTPCILGIWHIFSQAVYLWFSVLSIFLNILKIFWHLLMSCCLLSDVLLVFMKWTSSILCSYSWWLAVARYPVDVVLPWLEPGAPNPLPWGNWQCSGRCWPWPDLVRQRWGSISMYAFCTFRHSWMHALKTWLLFVIYFTVTMESGGMRGVIIFECFLCLSYSHHHHHHIEILFAPFLT